MLDGDLGAVYGVPTRVLIRAVKRNLDRFPDDFMFQLTADEFDDLRSQSVTSSLWGGRRYPPYAFTEQDVATLSSMLRSKLAVQVNVEIMRAFARLRQLPATHADLAAKVDALERKCDRQFRAVFRCNPRIDGPNSPTEDRADWVSASKMTVRVNRLRRPLSKRCSAAPSHRPGGFFAISPATAIVRIRRRRARLWTPQGRTPAGVGPAASSLSSSSAPGFAPPRRSTSPSTWRGSWRPARAALCRVERHNELPALHVRSVMPA